MTQGEIVIAAPPELPRTAPTSQLIRLLPVVMSIATLVVMGMALFGRSTPGLSTVRSPMVLAFPMMLLGSVLATTVAGRRRDGGGIDVDRADYLDYLCGLRDQIVEVAAVQHSSVNRQHPEPEMLWTLVGGPRMWERRAADDEFCRVRVGTGIQPLATGLVAPAEQAAQRCDPITTEALRSFLNVYSTVSDTPIAIALRSGDTATIDGDPGRARALLRAMICQLAVLHPPDQVLTIGVISERNREHWDWLKWLPHNQHPGLVDATGSARMVYASLTEAKNALADTALPRVVAVADIAEHTAAITGMTVLEIGTACHTAPLMISIAGETHALARPDQMDLVDAVNCARRLAACRVSAPADSGWATLLGIDDAGRFDPISLWWRQDERLRVPIGTTVDGMALELDIKEPAEDGMGPHGLCVGATGSGKSELLRTIALGMMARNSPEVLNLLLIDFKGGATFLDMAQCPHVAAVITNLADEAQLVARMRDALAGEMNRRQQLLRTARCVSVAAYERVRRAGAPLAALPTLFVIVDEFSELLSQHPDFADMFVAIGRLGRSLGMHLLLASQRLDEGRLRGLEAHLSYRICLKTLSAAESRTVLGTLDAYQLPNTPGAGYLRGGTDELVRFQAAFVSGPLPPRATTVTSTAVQRFTAQPTGAAIRAGMVDESAASTVLHAILDRLSGQQPRAHQIWLPPLDAAPALDAVLAEVESARGSLTVPIGIIDRPFDQCRTPLIVELSGSAGNVAIVGAPQTGKSTALRTLMTALAATHDPGQVQFYCLDFGGGGLASMRALPHVGAVAGRAEPRLVERVIAELQSVLRSREAYFRDHGVDSIAQYRQLPRVRRSDTDPYGDVFLVIDGWAGVRHDFAAFEESITVLAAQGLSFGVHVVLSASRWAEIRPSLKDQIGTRIELRLGDPADSDVDRKRAQQVPRNRPGRGLSSEGLHMLIALPEVGERVGDALRRRNSELAAPPIRLLPNLVDYDEVVQHAGARPLLGLEEQRLRAVPIDFERHPHLLILGDNRCGKTATLRMLCREIVRTSTAAQARLLIVDYRRALLGVVESEHLGGYLMSPAALAEALPELLDVLRQRMPAPQLSQAQLRARSWWSGPDIYLVVDDYDLVATPGNPMQDLLEYLPHASDLGLHLLVARRSGGAARALFEPLLASLRDLGCMGLAMSGRTDDGALIGSVRLGALPPGRGILVTQTGDEQLVQVAWNPPP